MAVFLPFRPTKILMLCLLNGVLFLAVSPTISSTTPKKSCDNGSKTHKYTFRITPTGITTQSGIQGNVLLTLDKNNLCTDTTACEAELKSNKVIK